MPHGISGEAVIEHRFLSDYYFHPQNVLQSSNYTPLSSIHLPGSNIL